MVLFCGFLKKCYMVTFGYNVSIEVGPSHRPPGGHLVLVCLVIGGGGYFHQTRLLDSTMHLEEILSLGGQIN